MQALKWTTLILATVVLAAAGIQAQDGKEVTLKGNITCAKCELKQEAKCVTVINVKEGADKGVYVFDAATHKKYHKDICQAGKAGTVKGKVGEKDGKKTITVSELKYD